MFERIPKIQGNGFESHESIIIWIVFLMVNIWVVSEGKRLGFFRWNSRKIRQTVFRKLKKNSRTIKLPGWAQKRVLENLQFHGKTLKSRNEKFNGKISINWNWRDFLVWVEPFKFSSNESWLIGRATPFQRQINSLSSVFPFQQLWVNYDL